MPRSRSISIQSDTVPRRPALPCTAPASEITWACRARASVRVDLPASGWLMTANVRRERVSEVDISAENYRSGPTSSQSSGPEGKDVGPAGLVTRCPDPDRCPGGNLGVTEAVPGVTTQEVVVMDVTHHRSTTEGAVTTAPTTESTWFARALAALRISYGITFLWAFLDKTFALGFHTGYDQADNLDRFGAAAWINGGSPTEGFLTFGVPADNPFQEIFNDMAGYAVVDWLFMAGLLGVGVALLGGVAMRIATAAGALMYALMYVAVLPLENNPVVDDHLIGIIVMAVLVLGSAGTTWGLGRWWNGTGIVSRNPVLR